MSLIKPSADDLIFQFKDKNQLYSETSDDYSDDDN